MIIKKTMAQETEVQLFNKIMEIALQTPGVKVNREAFLRKVFSDFCDEAQIEQIIKENPRKLLELDLLDEVAKNVIAKARKEVTLLSAASGLPSNLLAMGGLAIVDMGQYMGFCMNVSQKLAYIYGYPDLQKNGQLSENSVNVLTAMLGVMFGVSEAVKAVNYVAKALVVQVANKLPAIAFGHATWYVFIKKICTWIGIRLSKQLFAKAVSKVIPVVGAAISGTITYASFGPAARKLALQLRYNSKFFKDVENTAKHVVEDAEFVEMNS